MKNSLVCPLCGGRDLVMVTDRVRFDRAARVHCCSGCDLTFLDPASFTYPRDFYEREYHQTYLTHVEPDALDPAAYCEKMRKATRIWADRFLELLTGHESVLDVGCSTGHFMDMIRGRTGRLAGTDLNVKEVAYARDVLGLDAALGPLEDRFQPGTFDWISMVFVLEHIAEPRPFLAKLSKFLKPGGKFLIVVPNRSDALVSFYDIPEYRSFYYCIEHLFYYTRPTMERLFTESGLRGTIETVQEYPLVNHLNWAYTRRPSDVLASRKGVPAVALADSSLEGPWAELWADLDRRYREFLAANEFGDRLWCVVGPQA